MLLWRVRKQNYGFTLVEMLVTAIVVGVIAAVASPNLLGMLNQNRVREGMRQVEGAVREAQKQATRKGTICSIRFTTTGSGSDKRSIIKVVDDASPNPFAGCLLNTRELPREVSFGLKGAGTLDDSNERDLSFSAKGTTGITGIMYIEHPNVNDKKCVEIQGMFGGLITGTYDSTTEVCTPPPAS